AEQLQAIVTGIGTAQNASRKRSAGRFVANDQPARSRERSSSRSESHVLFEVVGFITRVVKNDVSAMRTCLQLEILAVMRRSDAPLERRAGKWTIKADKLDEGA